MALSGSLATASPAAVAGAAPLRPLPYTLRPSPRPRLGQLPLLIATAVGSSPFASSHSAPSRVVAMKTTRAHVFRLVPRASAPGGLLRTSLPLRLSLAVAPTRLGPARYFRDGRSMAPDGEHPPPPAPQPQSSSSGGYSLQADSGAVPSPQGNAVPFVPSSRQRHQNHHHHHNNNNQLVAAASDAVAVGDGGAGARGIGGIGAREEAEAYAGPDEELRRRAHALRQAMFLEAEQRAVDLHPDLLVEDLAAEATVPYDATGSLESPASALARGDAGEAVGSPSGGSGPCGGVAVESVDPDTGGFTTSRPAVDPAYDDVGRAIREESDRHGRRRLRRFSVLAAEMRARKTATAEDLQAALSEREPELEATYDMYGLGASRSDADVEALLEAVPLGQGGAVLAADGEMPPEELALADPLGPAAGAAAGADPLTALEALEHQTVLERLESGASAASAYVDVSNVMPSPLPRAQRGIGSGSGSGGTGSAAGGGGAPAGRHASPRRRLSLSPSPSLTRCGGARSAAACHAPRPGAAAPTRYPPFYHTSPDVAEEDLQRRQPRRRLRRGVVPSGATAAAAARAVRADTPPTETAVSADAEVTGADVGSAAAVASSDPAANTHGAAAQQAMLSPLYNTSPDVPDEELEHLTQISSSQHSAVPGAATLLLKSGGNGGGGVAAGTQPPATAPPVVTSQKPTPKPSASNDSRRLKSFSDVDRLFIDCDSMSSWDEQAHDLRAAMRSTTPKPAASRVGPSRQATPPPGARGASSSLQTQTIGIHGVPIGTGSGVSSDGGGGGGADGRPVAVLRVECVPSQTYGIARTAAVLAADGQLTLLARPTGPSPERVRAALKLLRMAPDSRDFRASAAEAAAAAANNDERTAAAANQAAVAAAMAAVGTPGMELEAQLRPASSVQPLDERDLRPGLILGQSEIDPAEVPADPNFPLDSSWADHHDPHDPHLAPPMVEAEGHMLGLQANLWHEDYDEVMGQIYDGQRSGWSEDAVNGIFDSDVY